MLYICINKNKQIYNIMTTTNTLTQVTFANVNAKELKKAMTAYGIKVLMCKQGKSINANVAIEGSMKNFALWAEFAKENGYVNANRTAHTSRAKEDYPYIDLYGVYQIESQKSFIVK